MKIAIFGCLGRMGRELILEADKQAVLYQAIARSDNPNIGKNINELYCISSNIKITDIVDVDTDVVIDFSSVESSITLSRTLNELKIPHVIGTTGFKENELINLRNIASNNKIFLSYNMSIGIHILKFFLKQAMKILGNEYDIAISETHHKHKKDTPSGTALMLAGEVVKTNPLYKNNISFSSLRIANIIGEHDITLASDTEIINLSHKAQDRSIFAKGAIEAARWLIKQPIGFYDMDDMLKQSS